MQNIVAEVVADATRRPLPQVTPRDYRLPDAPGLAVAVIGMRRAGKTWFLFDAIHRLVVGGVPREDILYLNFEDDRLDGLSIEHLRLIDEAFYAVDPTRLERACWFFLDEIQVVQGWEKYVRRLLDGGRLRVVVSGSSAAMLSREVATSMRGRGVEFEVLPFSFREFLRHHGVDAPTRWPPDESGRAMMRHQLERYVEVGAFPDPQRLDAPLRRRILRSYVDVVILRDVIERHGATNADALRYLTRRLLGSPTCEFSVTKLYNDLRSQGVSVSRDTLNDYVGHLVDAFLVFPSEIDSESLRRRRVNPRKVYAIDHALARAYSARALPDRGHVLENIVYLALRRRGFDVRYGTSDEGWGVDFVGHRDGQTRLVQVCFSLADPETRAREVRGLRSMMRSRDVDQGLIVTWDDAGDEALAKDGIRVVQAWRWLLEEPQDVTGT